MTFICLLTFFNGVGSAQDSEFGYSLSYGQSQDNIDIYRVGLVKKWNARWLQNSTGYVDGYYELSYNRWKSGNDEINAVALSPVFQYIFNAGNKKWHPYLEGGIGVAYLDDYFINGRNLSSNLQFEDRIGGGLRFDNFDLSFRYMHYSNASLKGPNDGINIRHYIDFLITNWTDFVLPP